MRDTVIGTHVRARQRSRRARPARSSGRSPRRAYAPVAAGAWPTIGARLGVILEDAGLTRITSFGVQAYLPSRGAALLASVVRTLAPTIVQRGIATSQELDLPNLQRRLEDAIRAVDAFVLPPTLAGAWGYVPGPS